MRKPAANPRQEESLILHRRPTARYPAVNLDDGPPSILCIDDEASVLEGLAASLHRDYSVTIALGAEDAFGALQTLGPHTIVVSDMRMPGMDGAAFFAKLRRLHPDTIRILLTGHADVEDAARAVNEGQVWRILTKPCPYELLRTTLDDAAAEAKRLRDARAAASRPDPGVEVF